MQWLVLRILLFSECFPFSESGLVPGRERDEEKGVVVVGEDGFLGRGSGCLISAGQQVPLTSWE